ncbi:MAG: SpoIIE family protein phosphatase [Polyangiaceae bacterium]
MSVVATPKTRLAVGICIRPLAGETESGDACVEIRNPRGAIVVMADGLGHGARAAAAASAFVDCVREAGLLSLEELFARAHRALLKTRGAVAAVARFDVERGEVEIAGIGNISTQIARSGASRTEHPIVMPGVLGSAYRAVRPQVFPFGMGDLLVMHSDGIRSRFDLELARALPVQAAASAVVRSYAKGSDDAACAIVRIVVDSVPARALPHAAPNTSEHGIPIRMRGDAECAAQEAKTFALRAGFGARAQWEVSIVASELATNVLKFAGMGEVTLRHVKAPREAIVVEVVDGGRGIPDVRAAITDGFSEGALLSADRPRRDGQGLGVGLGSVHRLMDTVNVESDPAHGTRITAWKYRSATAP